MTSLSRGPLSVRMRALPALLFGLFSASSAFAGGTSFDFGSMSGLGTIGAGQAAEAGDASVIFSNPAALTRFKRAELTQGAAFITIDHNYTSRRNADGAPTDAGTQGSVGQEFNRRDGYDASALAPATFVAFPVNDKLVVGFSASASHGLVLHFDENYPGRNQGRDIDFKVTRLNLGFGYKLSPTLSWGMNGSYERFFQSVKLKINYANAVNRLQPGGTTLLTAAGATIPTEEARASLRMFGWAFNGQIGGLWEPTEKTRVGISYRPKTDFNSNRGDLKIQDTAEAAAFRTFLRNNAVAGFANGPQAADDLETEQVIKQDITLNDEFRLSAFHHLTPRLDVMGTYTRQDFTVTKLRYERERNGRLLQDIPQNFQVTQSYRVGVNYKLYRRLTLKAGYATENSAIDDATRITILPDSDRKFYSLGAQLEISPDTTMYLGYVRLVTDTAPVGNNTENINPPEVRGGPFSGDVKLKTQIFGIGLTDRF